MWSYRFPSPVILSISGKDAERYSHNRLSNDVKNLAVGASCVAGALTAQGRTQALFTVVRLAPNAFLLIADGGDKEKVKNAFTQFLVADRVAVEDVGASYGFFHVVATSAVIEDLQRKYASAIKRICTRSTEQGLDMAVLTGEVESLQSELERLGIRSVETSEYTLKRLKGGIAVFPDEINESAILTESGRTDSVMFGKGCYVGQEVIEKIDAVGRLPKILIRLRCQGNVLVAPEAQVLDPRQRTSIGRVLSHTIDSEASQTWLFAYVKNGQVTSGGTVLVAEKLFDVI